MGEQIGTACGRPQAKPVRTGSRHAGDVTEHLQLAGADPGYRDPEVLEVPGDPAGVRE